MHLLCMTPLWFDKLTTNGWGFSVPFAESRCRGKG